MNTKFLDKWKILDPILEKNGFLFSHTIDSWEHHYYSEKYDGHIVYDISKDSVIVFDSDYVIIHELFEESLNKEKIKNLLKLLINK